MIRITEAISLCNVATSKPIKEIESEIRFALWPDAGIAEQKNNLYRLKKGIRKTFDFETIQIICELTLTDPNFLFNYKS